MQLLNTLKLSIFVWEGKNLLCLLFYSQPTLCYWGSFLLLHVFSLLVFTQLSCFHFCYMLFLLTSYSVLFLSLMNASLMHYYACGAGFETPNNKIRCHNFSPSLALLWVIYLLVDLLVRVLPVTLTRVLVISWFWWDHILWWWIIKILPQEYFVHIAFGPSFATACIMHCFWTVAILMVGGYHLSLG